jgi:predicted kinase
MATLHFICGKAGAGKTTLGRELGRTLPGIFFGEDEWIVKLGFECGSIEEFRNAYTRVRAVIRPLAVELLRIGVSVVFDFGGNTPKHREWVRGIFEEAGADHVLHLIESSDAQCLDNIHRRNEEQTPGLYWGHVSDETYHSVMAYFVPPAPEEGFHIVARTSFAQR